MAHYKANSTNSRNFTLTHENSSLGELIYAKWYSFSADIRLADGSSFQLVPKGFWDSTIELKKEAKTLVAFHMGWKGIVIQPFFDQQEGPYLLALKGLLSSTFIVMDVEKRELLAAETHFTWNKLNYDYTLETTEEFEALDHKELRLLTILHCINYYMTLVVSAG